MRTNELLNLLKKANTKLIEAKNFVQDEPHRESAIQRFEYTFELSWKLMSSFLKDEGQVVYGVKTIIRHAAKFGLIDEVEKWFAFAKARNESSHIYHDDIAKKIYEIAIGEFSDHVDALIAKIESKD